MNRIEQIQDHFNRYKYVVIKGFLDPKTAALFYQYCIVKVQRTDFLIHNAENDYRPLWDGAFNDGQVNDDTYFCYADPLMDSLLVLSTGSIEQYTGLKLCPTYSYWRFYQKDADLKPHIDREECEVSTTLCLGYNTSNVDKNKYPNYSWPMFVEDSRFENGMPASLEPGDLIIYKGCELSHWREPFLGLNHAQMFMHYNNQASSYQNVLDGRPILGIPKQYQRDQYGEP